METAQELLLQEAKKQGVLRFSASSTQGRIHLTAQDALEIIQKYRTRVQEAQFPEMLFWMLQ